MYRKRGQESGGSAAALVSIIALLIVLYILFLPPDVREDLLDDDGTTMGGSSDNINDNFTFLEESPGRLDFLTFSEYEHDISPIYLLKTTESQELKAWNTFHVKNGVFDKSFYETRFAVKDKENTNNLLLSFVAREYKGTLLIKLNGQPVFEGEITTFNPPPISLPEELLIEDNILEFEVSSVGWKFWTTNEFVVEGMKVIAQVTDTSRQESRNIFVMRDMEYFNLDRATLRFTPECSPRSVGSIEVMLNNQLVFSGIPDCGIPNFKEFSAGILQRGENKLFFKTLEGSYLVDGIIVNTELKELQYPLYHFEVNKSVYADIQDGDISVEMRLDFINDPGRKQGIVYVNGRTFSFSTQDKNWEKDISDYIEEEDNWLKIIPDRTVVDILDLSVVAFEE